MPASTHTPGTKPRALSRPPRPPAPPLALHFVCTALQTNTRVEFDPHVNFIVGANGSGKSAIVNALIAGFGHKAATTGRNSSKTATLIKHGASYALIQMHLANGGEDAYKPEEFGDTLVVEHRLEKSGGGSYKLKDGEHATGRSAKKKEIDEICAHLNIQANNPCALLTQEHAKKFLHEGNEQDRYRFFLQAANLETRKRDLNSAVEQVGVLKRRLESAKQGQSTKEEIARAAREEFEGATKLTELQVEMDSLEPLLGWALVNDRQDKITEAEEAIAKAEETEKATLDQMHTLTKEQGSVEAEVARLREKQKRAALVRPDPTLPPTQTRPRPDSDASLPMSRRSSGGFRRAKSRMRRARN